MTTRILHISDTHLGKRMYQNDLRRKDFTDAFEAAIDLAIQQNVDAVIHTGDLFDDPQPNLPTINECADILRKLDGANIPMYVIVGNHERKMEDQWVDLLQRFDLVKRLSTEPTTVGDFTLYGIDAIRKTEWEKTNFDLQPPESETATRVLCMHELVQPIVQEQRGAEYHVKEILDKLPFTPEALALGDYHGHEERWIDGCRIFYPGPTERTKVNENPGTVLLLETDASSRDFSVEVRRISEVNESVPRDFKPRSITIGTNQGLPVVEEKLQTLLESEGSLEDKAVVLTLTGHYNEVSASDVYDLLDEYQVPIQKVLDKRASESVDVDIDMESLEKDLASIDNLLDEATSSVDKHQSVESVAKVVSDDEYAKTNIRGKTKELLEASFEESQGDTA